MTTNPFAGKWAYRSLLNDPDLSQDFDKLEFGRGTLDIKEVSSTVLGGTIGGPGWQLALHGSFGYGSPMQRLASRVRTSGLSAAKSGFMITSMALSPHGLRGTAMPLAATRLPDR